MAEVAFHTGVADKLGYTCRLLRKAYAQGAKVVVTGAAEELSRLDVQLWVFEQEEFVPHARLRAGERAAASLAGTTPIWLVDDASSAPADASVLVNIGLDRVDSHERFARVIEIVADTPEAVQAGRLRWRQYVAAGTTPVNHAQGQG
ncbi:MAG: DNA polymerase III subunit chi [Burkholderiales bacterium]|nr:DNA polymerase III subunit chi [Burkholderiales bacterium]